MKIEFELQDPNKLSSILTLLRALGDISNIRVDSAQAPTDKHEPPSFFNRFYGSAKTGLTMEETDAKLRQLREEWDRTI